MWAILAVAALSFSPVAASAAHFHVPFTSLDLVYNGSSVYDATIYADIAINGVSGIPGTCGTVYGTEGYSDLLASSAGWGLALDVASDFQVIYDQSSANFLGIGLYCNIPAQSLPFSHAIGDPEHISFSTVNLTNVPSSGGSLRGFLASSTGEVPGPINKPTILLLGVGLVGIASFGRRRMRTGSPAK